MRERRREYELMIVISPLSANEEGVNATLDRLRDTIETAGGEITGINQAPPWGRRKLAYTIREYVSGEASRRNFSEGYYVLINMTLSASKVIELERTIKLTDAILRHLMTVIEPKGVKPVPDSPEANDEGSDEVVEETEA